VIMQRRAGLRPVRGAAGAAQAPAVIPPVRPPKARGRGRGRGHQGRAAVVLPVVQHVVPPPVVQQPVPPVVQQVIPPPGPAVTSELPSHNTTNPSRQSRCFCACAGIYYWSRYPTET
jgi:hypothetical protein